MEQSWNGRGTVVKRSWNDRSRSSVVRRAGRSNPFRISAAEIVPTRRMVAIYDATWSAHAPRAEPTTVRDGFARHGHILTRRCVPLHVGAMSHTFHRITSHSITSHYITLHCIPLQCAAPRRGDESHGITLHCNALYCAQLDVGAGALGLRLREERGAIARRRVAQCNVV